METRGDRRAVAGDHSFLDDELILPWPILTRSPPDSRESEEEAQRKEQHGMAWRTRARNNGQEGAITCPGNVPDPGRCAA